MLSHPDKLTKFLDLSIIYRSSIVLFELCGIGIGMDFTKGWSFFQPLVYFTYQSSVLVLIYFIINIIYTIKHIKNHGYQGAIVVLPKVKGAMTMSITITFLVYHFLLSATVFAMAEPYEGYFLSNILLHYIAPIMVIIDFMIFDKKGIYTKKDPLKWLLIPCAYFIFSIIRAYIGKPFSNGSRYPYFFIDIDKYGLGTVLINTTFLAVGFLIIGYSIYFIDKKKHDFTPTI